MRNVKIAQGEHYHIYNRGVDKRIIFSTEEDYNRFSAYLYLLNDVSNPRPSNFFIRGQKRNIFEVDRGRPLVAIGAYCLMPNHFHIVMRQRRAGGITTLMRKVGTAYSMYFNAKHDHSGTLLQGRFKSEHIDTERYLRWIFQYVHLNPLDIFESKWREVGLKDTKGAEHFIANYRWSSHLDYSALERSEQSILTMDDVYDKLDFNDALQFIREDKTVL